MKAVRALITAGSPIDISDCSRKTPLIYAAGRRHSEVVRELLAAKADVHRVDYSGATAFARSFSRYCSGEENKKIELAQILINAEASVDSVDEGGRTPLINAAERSDIQFLRFLLSANANVNVAGQWYTSFFSYFGCGTALAHGVYRNRLDIVEALLEANADVNMIDKRRRTILMLAFDSYRDCTETAVSLIHARASVNSADKEDKFAYFI